MIQQLVISAFLFSLFAFTFYAVFRMHISGKQPGKSRTWVITCFIFYLGAVAALTIIPLKESKTNLTDSHYNFLPVIKMIRHFQLLPVVKDQAWIYNFFENLVGNIIMFIPLGLFLPVLFKKKLVQVIVIAAICSILIETIQFLNIYLGYYRYVDVDDVLLNTFGAIVGYWLYKLMLNAGNNTRI